MQMVMWRKFIVVLDNPYAHILVRLSISVKSSYQYKGKMNRESYQCIKNDDNRANSVISSHYLVPIRHK
jgi:hypothetical protein